MKQIALRKLFSPVAIWKSIILTAFCYLITHSTGAQTTITTLGTGFDGSNNGGAPGAITFAITNNNTSPVILTDVGTFLYSTDPSATFSLWYNPTTLTGAPTITAAGGWTQITTGGTISPPSANGIGPVITGMSFSIPAATTWRFALTSTITIHYSGGTSTPFTSIFSANGIDLLLYASTISPGYAGTTPSPLNTPRAFTGFITFAPSQPCTGLPAPPVIMSGALTTPVCPNTTAIISATGPQFSQIFYQWQQSSSATGPWTNAGGTGTQTINLTTAPLIATTYYRLKDSCGVSHLIDTSAVYTVPVALAQITSVIPGFRCATGPDTLRAIGTGTNFRWYLAAVGGSPVATGSQYITPQISANTVFYVSSTNSTCESARVADTAYIRTPPPAVITPSSSPVFCTGGSVVLNANAPPANTTYSYVWQFNGVNNGVTTIKDTANNTGNYTVTVRDNNTTCATLSAPLATTAGAPPPAFISPAGAVGICPNGCTRLVSYSAPGLVYTWYYNGSPITGATDSAYCATLPGMYTVKVATVLGNCFSITQIADSLYAFTAPLVAISSSANTICQGSSVVLTPTPNTGFTGFQWQNNGSPITSAVSNFYAVSSAGAYSVKVTDSRGCVGLSNTLNLTVTQLPPAVVSPSASSRGCDSVVLNANGGSSSYTYQWRVGGTGIPGATTAIYSAKATGSYSVTVTNSAGCSTTSTPVSDTVKLSPVSTITYFSPLTFCDGSAVVLNIYSVTGTKYQWRKDTVAIAGVTSLSYTVSTSGSYEVLVTDSVSGCSRASLPVVVQVNAAPVPVIVGGNGGLTTTTAYSFYQWRYNTQVIISSFSTGSSYVPDKNGAYSVTVIDSNGCTGTSDVFFVNGVGVAGVKASEVQVYPNPVMDWVNVKAPVGVEAVVRDMTGRDVAVMKEKAAGKTIQVDVHSLAAGMYLLIISDEHGSVIRTDKLIKE